MSEGHLPLRNQAAEKAERALILADLAHFEEKFWRNEEVGEKRLNYFVTLITAAAAGLVALHTADSGLDPDPLWWVTNGTLGVLVLLGVVTYFRMLRRNEVTDEYKETMDYLRERYVKLVHAPAYEVPQRVEPRWHDGFRGGLADTAAAATSVSLTALLLSLGRAVCGAAGRQPVWLWALSIGAGSVCLGLMVRGARRREQRRRQDG